ncbi:MAG: thioredoxin [Eubacteriales bacterium]|nr:thioredoxin [Eubacteriales bacterium]
MRFTSDNFQKEVLESSLPVLVDFYADWCGPCKMMAPVVEEMETLYEGKVRIGKLNVDDNPEIAERYNVMSIPNFIFFKDGKVVETAVGGMPRAALQAKIENLLK